MPVTPERKAELKAMIEQAIGGPLPRVTKPKVVITEELGVVRDADVKVSTADPNHDGDKGEVRVRRSDFVTINMAVWEAQQEDKREARRMRRRLDPARLGHWGSVDDDE